MLIKFAPASVATALASRVFPVPGGPNNKTPLHGWQPQDQEDVTNENEASRNSIGLEPLNFAHIFIHHITPDVRKYNADKLMPSKASKIETYPGEIPF